MDTVKMIFIAFAVVKVLQYLSFLVLDLFNFYNVQKHREVPLHFREKVTPDVYQKSRSYTCSKIMFEMIYESYDLLVLFAFIIIGGFGFAEKISSSLFTHEPLMGVFFCFAISIGKEFLDLPFSLYQTFVLEQRYGFNNMTYGLFFKDMGKKFVLSLLIGGPLIYFLLWIIISTGANWWIYGFLALIAFQVLIIWIYPTWIAPFFNKFSPLEKGELREKIFKIASDVQFTLSEIFVMDGSKRSSHSNAYFTGLGKNRRIVLFDTLIQLLTQGELIGVLAHEMGHNKLKHIQKTLILSSTLIFAGFYFWSLLLNYAPLYQAFGLSGNTLFPALMVFPLIMGPVTFFLHPLTNLFSRKHEFEADAFSARVTLSASDLQTALLKLNEKNLSNLTPHPVYSFFYYSHPTLAERLKALDALKS